MIMIFILWVISGILATYLLVRNWRKKFDIDVTIRTLIVWSIMPLLGLFLLGTAIIITIITRLEDRQPKVYFTLKQK